MKPFARLRGKMSEMDINGNALANYLGKSPSYVSYRLTHYSSWELDEAYKVLKLLNIPEEEIFTYFPPNGGLPVKEKRPGIRHCTKSEEKRKYTNLV